MRRTQLLGAASVLTTALMGMLTGTLAIALSAGEAHAQQAGNGIETVVVTAEKRSEDIQNVPISIQVFTAQSINDLGIKSSTDLGYVTPNVEIALPSGAGSQPIVTIRGIGLNDYDTNNAGPNGVYVDEVYLSSPVSQTFQVFDLERIEVLKGPQGTLYGRNTSGGAINFITQKPTDDLTGRFHAEYSSFNTVNLEAALGGPLADGLDGRIAIVKNNSDGYFHNDLTGSRENGTNNIAGHAMLQFKPSAALTLLLNVHGGALNSRPTEYRHVGTYDPATFAFCSVHDALAGGCIDLFGFGTPKGFYHGSFNRRQHLKINDYGGYLRADYAPGSVNFTSITAWQHDDKFHPEDSDAEPFRLLEINFGVKADTFTQEFRAAQSTDTYDWVVGLYYLNESLKQNQPIFILLDGDDFFGGFGSADDIAFQAFDTSHQVTSAYAAYGQADYNVTDKLKATIGLRYTTEKKSFDYHSAVQFQEGGKDSFGPLLPISNVHSNLTDSAISWRAALDYHVTDDILLYASAATGFKSGGFNGSFLSLDPAELAVQLKPIRPEHVLAYEVGLKSSLLDDRLIFNAALFYNDYRKMQVFVLVPPVAGGGGFPVNVLDNARKAHTEGADIEVVAKPWPELTARVQLGLLQTRLDSFSPKAIPGQDYSGNDLPLAPHVSLSVFVDYTVPLGSGSLDFQFNANYKSHQFFDISNDLYTTQSAYWLENVRVAYDFSDNAWEIAAYVRNLSDKKYLNDSFDLSNPFGLIEQIVGVPRTIGAEATYKF
ncbi:MAG: TonB-dependent receptor [Proteobacteria bacterium]|nr:TonB-dependent receptor [Pseudomonadota bacterium]